MRAMVVMVPGGEGACERKHKNGMDHRREKQECEK